MIDVGRLLPSEARALARDPDSSTVPGNNTRQGYVRKDTLKLVGFLCLVRADAV
jgi:hypothetical protein